LQNQFRQFQIIAAVLVFIILAYAGYKASRPDVGLITFKVDGSTAYVNGGTNSGSLFTFRQFLNDNPQIDSLILQNMPGTQDATTNLKIARLIRDRGLSVHLERRSFIASGAVDWFLAGKGRTMECGARIGVHSWSVRGDNFGIYSPDNLGWDDYRKHHETFLSDMGIDPAFYVFTREAAPATSLHILTPEDIKRFNLLTENGCRSY